MAATAQEITNVVMAVLAKNEVQLIPKEPVEQALIEDLTTHFALRTSPVVPTGIAATTPLPPAATAVKGVRGPKKGQTNGYVLYMKEHVKPLWEAHVKEHKDTVRKDFEAPYIEAWNTMRENKTPEHAQWQAKAKAINEAQKVGAQ